PFGIVTRMTFHLTPIPASLRVVRFELRSAEKLGPAIDAIRRLRMDGTVRAPIGLWNDYRALSTEQQYPWELTGGRTPLTRADLAILRPGAPEWSGVFALHAPTEELAGAAWNHVERTLAPAVDVLAVDASESASTTADPASRFSRGVPHEASLRSVY